MDEDFTVRADNVGLTCPVFALIEAGRDTLGALFMTGRAEVISLPFLQKHAVHTPATWKGGRSRRR
jgi:hypothetical protein